MSARRICWAAIAAAGLAGGCQRPHAPPPSDLLLPVRVVVLTDAAGSPSPWEPAMQQDCECLRRVFAKAGIAVQITTERQARPSWYDARAGAKAAMMASRSAVRTLWLCRSISFTDAPTRGFAAFDGYLAWAPSRCPVSFPHELAHICGLAHLEQPGNVMRGLQCGGENWTAEQVSQLRAACN